ncbi:MAG: hypothetical protein C0606_12120 [Hyphomicrobiales bacterium]|nr:MAG: hypothetical protein C0606_12120 [Hyphomicrobiales bacterium]
MIRASMARAMTVVFLSLLVLALPIAADKAAAEPAPANVAVSVEPGFGRIVLTFKGRALLPKYTSKTANGVLVVAFEEPVAAQVDQAPITLPDYISIARSDPDGSALRLALKRGVRVNLMDAGEKLFIDLLPARWAGNPPPLPADVIAELAQRAKEALERAEAAEHLRQAKEDKATLVFHAAEAPTFTRLTFEWDKPFGAKFARDGKTITIDFDRFADIDLSLVRAQPPRGLVEVAARETGKGLSVDLTVGPETGIRAFREEGSYVVDLTGVSDLPLNPAAEAVKQALRPQGAPADEIIIPPTNSGTPQTAGGDTGANSQNTKTTKLPPMPAALGGPGEQADAGAEPAPENVAQAPEAEAESENAPAQKSALPPPPYLSTNPEALPVVRERKGNFIRVEARRIGNTVRMTFPFPEPVAAATFRRGKHLWMVFDTPVPMDTRAIRTALGPQALDLSVSRSGGAQALRIELKDPLLTTIGIDGNAWLVTIGDIVLEPSRPLQIARSVSSTGGAILKIPFPQAGQVHKLDDPVVGDRIHVVTGYGPARGLFKPHRFVDLATLPSAHGVALVGFADDLVVSAEDDAIEVGRGRGLTLSSNDFENSLGSLVALQMEGREVEPESMLEISVHRLNPIEYRHRLNQLQEAIVDASEKERNQRRLDLARFFLAERMPYESLAVLKAVLNADPKRELDPSFSVLLGAAETLVDRPKDAHAHLFKQALDKNPDAAFWRTIAAVKSGDWKTARETAPLSQSVFGGYPIDLQNEFTLAATKSAIELNDFGAADEYLAELLPEHLDPTHLGRYDVLRGRVADASGRVDEALALYDRVGKGTFNADAAEAQYRALRIRHREGKLDAKEASDALEKLAIRWRGDEVELQVLRFLAQASAENGNYRRAFEAMKTAIIAAPDAETSRLVQDEMSAVFASLFLDHKADDMSPINALTLYYDFRELTPIGRRGDEMVRDLAERLIDVDLLDQAAELLQHQVDNRLKGVARAQIAADLGLVYLLDRKPERALGVLSRTRQARLPGPLDRQRRVVEARALAATKRVNRALDLIASLQGPDIERLRADIMWDAGHWREAGEQLEAMQGQRWADPAPFSEQERIDVLRAAIAYSQADDQLSLDRLRSKFSTKLADSEHAHAFDVVTRPIEDGGSTVEFAEIASKIASIDTLEGFLEEYRKHYMKHEHDELPGAAKDAVSKADEAPAGDAPAEQAAEGVDAAAADAPAKPDPAAS